MPNVRISVPFTGLWFCDVNIPEDQLDDVAGYLSENDDVLQDVLEQGWEGDREIDLMDVKVEG